nr:integrase, catalytic region, zinc finger, CCHC-type, peptidase aspartic, catalytic [Tanacetum cinerariifolium]
MHADLKYVETLKKEIDELESDKAEFSDMYDVILQECVSKDVMCSYLMSLSDLDALDELQCLYLHKVKECDCLAQKLSTQTEYVSKKVHTKLLQRFAKLEKHSISLEIALQKCKEQVKNDTVCNEKAFNVFRKEREQYFKIQDLKAKLQDKNIAISELKKLIEKGKGKSMDTKFDRPSVVREPNAQRILKPSVLEGLSKTVTAQTLPQTVKKAVSNTNVLKPGMYRINNRTTHTKAPQLPQTVRNNNPRVSTSTGVNHKPTVSRLQLKSNQSRDKVMPNNSQVKVKMTQVKVHPRIPSVSNKTKSVTTCKTSSNSRTLNANDVCATCNKCLIDSNHFACVTKMLNDVHARTKKPTVVPISTRKPKSQANKSIAIPNKKKVASKSTKQKPQSYFRVLYENTNKAWKWKLTCFVRDLQGNDLLIETSVANNTSGLVPQRQKASDYDNPNPVPQRQDVSSLTDADVPSQQELDLLFGPLYDEFFNVGSNTSTKIPSTSAPSTHTNVHAEENNNDQAEEGEQLQDDKFTNPICAPTQEVAESSSHNLGNLNVSTFNQPHISEYRWTKDHSLKQVRGNLSRPVQTRRQIAIDPKMYMYALTVSNAEPKNIKEAMADSAWIEAMQEELHQFNRLQVWELVDKPFGKSIIRRKWLWKNKKDEDQTVIRNKA